MVKNDRNHGVFESHAEGGAVRTIAGFDLHLQPIMSIPYLRSRWVFVTGGASGIGLETAKAFAHAGANVFLSDVQADALEHARREIAGMGVACRAALLDVSHPHSVQGVADEFMRQCGAPAVVVNNAGIGFLGPFLHTPLEAWRRLLDVNLMGMVHVCRAFMPGMLKEGLPAHIVNVASAAGLHPAPNLSAYSASKHAVMGLHDALAMELRGTNIGLSVVCPGVINTPIVRNRQAVADIVPGAQLDKIAAYYEKHGAPPALVARRIVRAVQRGEDLVLVGPTVKPLYMVKRVSRVLASLATLDACKANGYLWRYERER